MNEQTTLALTVRTSGEIATAAGAAGAKALIEAQFTMAAHKPRNLLAARGRILDACKRPGFAATAWYAKPQGGKKIRGPSIRFAEMAIQAMGNITVIPMVTYEDRERLMMSIQVIDLETNTAYSDPVSLAKTVERKDKTGREVISERANTNGEKVFIVLATEDEMANKINSAKSKSIRNSGLRLIPQDFIEEAEMIVADTMAGGGGDPAEAVKKMADAFARIGVKPDELVKYIGHPLESLSPAELADLREVYQTLKDGEAKWSDYVEGGQRRGPKEAAAPMPDVLKPKAAVVDEPEEESPQRATVRSRLEAGGFTPEEFMAFMVANGYAIAGDTFDNASDDNLDTAIDQWPVVEQAMAAAKKKGKK